MDLAAQPGGAASDQRQRRRCAAAPAGGGPAWGLAVRRLCTIPAALRRRAHHDLREARRPRAPLLRTEPGLVGPGRARPREPCCRLAAGSGRYKGLLEHAAAVTKGYWSALPARGLWHAALRADRGRRGTLVAASRRSWASRAPPRARAAPAPPRRCASSRAWGAMRSPWRWRCTTCITMSPPSPPPRTKWTRRVRHPVLSGHAAGWRCSA